MTPPLPPFAYVPGMTPRPDEAFFDDLHGSVPDTADPETLLTSPSWRAGLFYLDHGYFWEAHEALEPVWMRLAEGSEARELVQGAIQLANAALKARMGRRNAVLRLCDIAEGHLARAGEWRDRVASALPDWPTRIAALRAGVLFRPG